jgi:primary-amine oxidase
MAPRLPARESDGVTDTVSRTTVHPLEPLTVDELSAAVAAFREHAEVGDSRFAYVVLHEPDKHAAPSGDRRARIVAVERDSAQTIEAVVSVATGTVISCRRLDGEHAPILNDEGMLAMALVMADERFLAGLARRGITDPTLVQLDPWPAGNWTGAAQRRRVVRVIPFLRPEKMDNGYARPIEGLLAIVDAHAGEVVEVLDHGVVPMPDDSANYDVAAAAPLRDDLRPLAITQTDGPSFTVDGHEIRWQRWRLRVSMHPIEGLVIHDVGYEDHGRLRPILHRASLSEMVVPYGSSNPGHSWKNAFDVGEYGFGRAVNSLVLGCDCLGEIRYFDANFVGDSGEPYTVKNAICLHEEDYGVLWKHYDFHTDSVEVRRSRRLVVSSFHTLANYEYGLFWYFYLDGTIQLEIKLTGIVSPQTVARGATDDHAERVAPQVAAPHHQHLFNFRLDFDVDGTTNTVYEVDVEPAPPGDGNPLGNAFVTRATPLTSEHEARRLADATRDRTWNIVNPSVRNALGQPVAYKLVPGPTRTLIAAPDSSVGGRAGFARYNLWVTPYHPDERRAASDYVNLHPGGGGLPAWTAADRDIDGADVVLWYTFGLTHIGRPEDWPVMPVEYSGFLLKPAGFFDRNPALDVAPSTNGHCHGEG